jgi:hypothetical protein
VKLLAFGHEVITRRVVEVRPGVVYVCREDEYERAARERREPITVGFASADVLES